MTPVSGRDARASLVRQMAEARAWADSRLGQVSVALVYGGISAEDQLYISKSSPEQLSVTALSRTLHGLGVRYEVLDPCQPSFIRDLPRFDVALSNLHGPFGEDGRLQGLLDYLRVPYCGSGVAASAVAADKILCKRVMESLAVPTPAWRTWPGPAAWPGRPVLVKPRAGGSSVGMSLVRREDDLPGAIMRAEPDRTAGVLIEDHVTGLPVTVAVLELPGGPVIFPPLATLVHTGEFYDADAKLGTAGEGTVTCTQADLPAPVTTALDSHVATLWDGLGCNGMARVDFIAADDGTVAALEVNTTPGMSYESNFITAAEQAGLSHADVVIALLREALTRPRYDAPLPVPDFTTPPA